MQLIPLQKGEDFGRFLSSINSVRFPPCPTPLTRHPRSACIGTSGSLRLASTAKTVMRALFHALEPLAAWVQTSTVASIFCAAIAKCRRVRSRCSTTVRRLTSAFEAFRAATQNFPGGCRFSFMTRQRISIAMHNQVKRQPVYTFET